MSLLDAHNWFIINIPSRLFPTGIDKDYHREYRVHVYLRIELGRYRQVPHKNMIIEFSPIYNYCCGYCQLRFSYSTLDRLCTEPYVRESVWHLAGFINMFPIAFYIFSPFNPALDFNVYFQIKFSQICQEFQRD